MQFLREHDIPANLQLALKECLEVGHMVDIRQSKSLLSALHQYQNSPTPPFPSFHSHCPLLPSLPLSLPTCCGLSLPVTRRTKSSSERVREHPGFFPTGSPGWIDPGEFFKSAAVCGVCGVCGASCVQNCVHRHVTQCHASISQN